MRIQWIVALALLSCRPAQPPRVPSQYEGDIVVSVQNQYGVPLCRFAMWSKGEFGAVRNWLQQELPAGASFEVKLKRGVYTVNAGCDSKFNGMKDVSIVLPTNLGIGNKPGSTRGRAKITVPLAWNGGERGTPPPSGGGGGGEEEGSCTGMCGGPQGMHGNCCPDEGWHCVIDPQERSNFGENATGVCTLQ